MEKITTSPKVLSEHYEVEFVEDPEGVYECGEQVQASSFIDDYCYAATPSIEDVCNWLRRIPVPEAVKFCADAWGIAYRLHEIKTIDTIIA